MDRLESKSNALLQTARDTSSLVHLASKLHNKIIHADETIGTLNHAISENYSCLHKLDQLHEKTFFLESSLPSNDTLTSETTWSNLNTEYKYILTQCKTLRANVSNKFEEEEEEEVGSLHDYNNNNNNNNNTPKDFKSLKNSISVSDIRLKPIRCRSKKMYKKKSKYRISSIYNINPLAYSPVMEVPNSDIEKYSPFPPQLGTFDDSECLGFKNNEELTVCTSPSRSMQFFTTPRNRSNSVPETHLTYPSRDSVSGLNIFNVDSSMKSTNILNNFQEQDSDTLRLNRLKHFISCDRGLNSVTGPSQLPPSQLAPLSTVNSPEFSCQAFNKTPTFTPVDGKNDIDNISICSDLSYYSPEKYDTKLEEDDFEKYLRKSRIDLREVLPNLVKRSTSHESVLSNHITVQEKHRFHNPIDNITLSSLMKVPAPTLQVSDDYIYYRGTESSQKDVTKDHNTKDLLNQVMLLQQPQIPPTDTILNINSSPKKVSFSLFNFNSSSSAPNLSTPPTSISFSDSLMSFVHSTPEKKKKLKKPEPPQPESRHVEISKTKPITIENTSHMRRIPPARSERTDGFHSKLTIGPNKTRILNHGELSYFRKPLVSKVSHNSLHEALSYSIMD